jgi:hypothetical protein
MLMMTKAIVKVVGLEFISSLYHYHPTKTHSSVFQVKAFGNMHPQFYD